MAAAPKVLLGVRDELQLAAALRRAGWEVVSAGDALKAYSAARSAAPAVVVLDWRLERGGAVAAAHTLRSSPHTAHLPIVALAPRSSPTSRELLGAGVEECLDAAVDIDTIVATVRKLVRDPPVAPLEAPATEVRSKQRLAALQASGLLDSPVEVSFDELTRLVARLLSSPVALLSIVDKDRQFFKSQVGLQQDWATRRQTPLSHSFCQWVVASREQVSVEDARVHPVLKSNLAVRDLGVVAYAGVPLRANGHILGSLCAIDSRPRAWSAEQIEVLRDLSCVAEALVEQEIRNRPADVGGANTARYCRAVAGAASACIRLLRRSAGALAPDDRDAILEQIERYVHTLAELGPADPAAER